MPKLTRDVVAKTVVLALYLLSIVAGVAAIKIFGVVPIPGGFMAPAAVYVVGVTLILRDWLHELTGRRTALLAIIAGAGLSAAFDVRLALASGLAFLISEVLDLLVYEQVRNRFDSVPTGMAVSNTVSIPVDSLIFLGLAFGSLDFFWGQVIGKGIATVVAIVVLVGLGTIFAMITDHKARKAADAAVAAEEARWAAMTPQERSQERIVQNLARAAGYRL